MKNVIFLAAFYVCGAVLLCVWGGPFKLGGEQSSEANI